MIEISAISHCAITAAGDAEPHRQGLQQHRRQAGQQHREQ
jgi:hypothetical protein